ncbi:MAG TPA: hypothetical protein VL424_09330 [Pararobbsia sp.]|jgi:hypothetical protein|nr:hypothetical protein [Pararobbsia sp.]
MNCIIREEFEARIETIETRMDARVNRIEANTREIEARMDARVDRIEANTREIEARMDARVDRIEANTQTMGAQMDARIQGISDMLAIYRQQDRELQAANQEALKTYNTERDKRLEERDARLQQTAHRSAEYCKGASDLKRHFWGAVGVTALMIVPVIYGPQWEALLDAKSQNAPDKTAPEPPPVNTAESGASDTR